ncbi:hypothetical protein THAOC_14949, partial [Thalassiosira oceanica]
FESDARGAEEPPGHVQPKTPGCLHQGAHPQYPRSIPSAKRHKGPGSLGSEPTLVRSGARLHKRTGTHTKAACLVEGTYSPVAPPLPAHRSLYFILLDSTAMPSLGARRFSTIGATVFSARLASASNQLLRRGRLKPGARQTVTTALCARRFLGLGLFSPGCATYLTKYDTLTAKIGSQPRRYRRIPSPSTRGRRPDYLDSGGSGHGLRTFRATLHRGEKDRESRLAHQAGTHHQVDSQRKSSQSSSFQRPPEFAGGSRHERLDIAEAIIWWRLRSGPVNIASGAGRGLGSMLFALSIVP